MMKKILIIMRETFPTNEILTKEKLENKRILNPYDEYALFQGKKIKEAEGGEIICFLFSERKSQYSLRTALGLGGDRGIFIHYPEKDEKIMGKILAEEIKKESYDAIFIGIRDVNDDREELPYVLGKELTLPVYSHILSVKSENNYFIVKKEREKTVDTIKICKKGIFAFSQNVYEPQYPSILNIMSIKDKSMREVYFEKRDKRENVKIIYQDIYRKQEIYKKIGAEEGTEKIIDYMKKWKLID